MKGVTYIVMLGTLGVCKSQFIAISPTSSKQNLCDYPSSTALVEKFFDLIFTEFHNTPPACVCIQMCVGQPIYCYPNGCLKRTGRKMVEENHAMLNSAPIVNLAVQSKSTLFETKQRDLMNNFIDRPGINTLYYKDATEKPNNNEFIHPPNSLRELLHKYKKLPKLEMRYNLREQVKNTKSDKLNRQKNVDISKTRWPLNKNMPHGKTFLRRERNHKKPDIIKQSKVFVSTFMEHDPVSYNPVYDKKYMAKRENSNGINDDAVYLYQINTTNFTMEALIDNIIKSGLNNYKKDTFLSSTIKLEDTFKNEQTTNSGVKFTDLNLMIGEENHTNTVANNRMVDIISIKSTLENKDTNEHLQNTNLTNSHTTLDMIANMNKEIEKQNNASLEFIERVTGTKIIYNELSTTDNDIENDVTISTLIRTEEIVKKTKNATVLDRVFMTENINVLPTELNENFTVTIKPVPATKSLYNKRQQRKIPRIKCKNLN